MDDTSLIPEVGEIIERRGAGTADGIYQVTAVGTPYGSADYVELAPDDDEFVTFRHGENGRVVFEVAAPKGSLFRVSQPTPDAPLRVVVTPGDPDAEPPSRSVAVDYLA